MSFNVNFQRDGGLYDTDGAYYKDEKGLEPYGNRTLEEADAPPIVTGGRGDDVIPETMFSKHENAKGAVVPSSESTEDPNNSTGKKFNSFMNGFGNLLLYCLWQKNLVDAVTHDNANREAAKKARRENKNTNGERVHGSTVSLSRAVIS